MPTETNNNFKNRTKPKMTVEQLNAQYGKIPPQAPEVEEAVLGALMLERDAYIAVADILKAESFYKEIPQDLVDRTTLLLDNSMIKIINQFREFLNLKNK